MQHPQTAFQNILREWRNRRRYSQLALATEAEISQRHLSFLEAGRSKPSRDMVRHLSEVLSIPLDVRNEFYVAAGFAPIHRKSDFSAPEFRVAREAIRQIIAAHMPWPSLVVDRHWTLLEANPAAAGLMDGVASHLLEGDINVLRLSLHPEGLAPRILNLAEWRAHILGRLKHEVEISADERLIELRRELQAMSGPGEARPRDSNVLAVPLRLKGPAGPLSFISTTTVFGSATDVALADVTIESFFPADEATRAMILSAESNES